MFLCAACDAGLTTIGTQSQADPTDAARFDEGTYLEAEGGVLSGGFTIESDPKASASHYLAPPPDAHAEDAPGSARARYSLSVTDAGEYVIWGRIHSPDPETNRFWIQVDGGTWYKWRISAGDIWYWDRFHDDMAYDTPLQFSFAAGEHTLLIANCVPGVGLDRLFFAGADSPAAPSGNDTLCNPPHSIDIAGACQPSCGSLGGSTCGADECRGQPLLSAYDCEVCCRRATKM
jgi:hypothetical protein